MFQFSGLAVRTKLMSPAASGSFDESLQLLFTTVIRPTAVIPPFAELPTKAAPKGVADMRGRQGGQDDRLFVVYQA